MATFDYWIEMGTENVFLGARGWLSQWSMRPLDLGVVNSSPTLGIEITFF